MLKLLFIPIHSWINWVDSDFSKLLIFLHMPLSVDTILPERAIIAVCMIFSFVFDTLKWMSIEFSFLSFEPKKVSFKINIATLCYLSMVFNFMRIFILLAVSTIWIAGESNVLPLLKILVLGNTRVHIYSINCYNVLFHIETFINKTFNLCTILKVLNVNPYNGHI